MDINNYVNGEELLKNFRDFSLLLESADASISSRGQRILQVPRYEGIILLDELARKLLEASAQHAQAGDLTTEQRIAGIKVSKTIKNFYHVTDTQLGHVNWLTWVLNALREIRIFSGAPRVKIEADFVQRYFQAYDEKQFVKEFQAVKDTSGLYSHSIGHLGSQILADEKELHKKLADEYKKKGIATRSFRGTGKAFRPQTVEEIIKAYGKKLETFDVTVQKRDSNKILVPLFTILDLKMNGKTLELIVRYSGEKNPEIQLIQDESSGKLYLTNKQVEKAAEPASLARVRIDLSTVERADKLIIYAATPAIWAGNPWVKVQEESEAPGIKIEGSKCELC